MRLPCSIALLTAALTSTAGAQTVHVVGPGGFPQIQPAINAASPGDVVVVQAGTYDAFTLTKDLTLTAAPGAVVDVQTTTIFTNSVTIVQPPGMATVTGLRFRTLLYAAAQTRVLGGTVHFADCAFESSPGFMPALPALVVQNANVALQRCVVLGGGVPTTTGGGSGAGCNAMTVDSGTVAATDSLFLGGNIHWDFLGHGGHAIAASAADVHLANCIVIGGGNDPLISYHVPGSGVHVEAGSRVWLADCQVVGGDGRTVGGGAAVENLGTTPVVVARSTLLGGPGAPIGPSVIGPLTTGPLLGLSGTTAPITLGAAWTVGYRAAPATPVLVLASERIEPSSSPLVAEPVWLPTNAFVVAAAGVTDASGVVAFAFAVPPTPSLLHASWFVQGFAGTTLPLRTTPAVGGSVR